MEKSKLEMEFIDKDNKKFVISLDNPRSDIESSEVSQVMETILEADIFQSKSYGLMETKEARIVTTTISKLEV